MPRIEFLESLAGPAAAIDLPEGGELRDACDRAGAPVPFSCRSTSCGTCRVDVVEGGDLLLPPNRDELDVLEIFADDPARRRLACTARVRKGEGTLRLRAADDW